MVKENGNTGIDIVDPDPSLSWWYGLWSVTEADIRKFYKDFSM